MFTGIPESESKIQYTRLAAPVPGCVFKEVSKVGSPVRGLSVGESVVCHSNLRHGACETSRLLRFSGSKLID